MNIYKLTLVAMFASLTAVGAFIRIPLPYVPLTLQVFFVFLAGVLLGPRLGALSQIIYILLGLIGLPIFAEGGGIGYVLHPSFGFLLGFVVVSYFIGLCLANDSTLSFWKTFTVGIIGIILLYLIAVPYLYIILKKVIGADVSLYTSFVGMLVFVPGDILKALGVALIAPRIRNVLADKPFKNYK
jgi:biotin transport system substrate-specific component